MPILKNYKLVTDYQDVPEILNILDRQPKISFDFETTGLNTQMDAIHGISLATHDQEWYVTLGAEKAMLPDLVPIFNNKDKLIIAHNAVFDLHFINRYGECRPNIYDTMIAQWLIDENQSVGLKELAHTKLGIEEELPDFKELQREAKRIFNYKKLSDVSIYDMPLEVLAEYGARDSRLTYDLEAISTKELSDESLLDMFYNTEMPFIYTVLDMEARGLFINQGRMRELEEEFIEIRDQAYDFWMNATNGVNPRSSDQIGEYLYEKRKFKVTRFTKSKKPSTDKLSIMRLAYEDDTGVLDALLRYREYDKLINTYIQPFWVKMINGRIYGKFNVMGTVTGRFSSSDPNLQNLPAHGEGGEKLREIITAPVGYTLVDIDYSQLELRLVTHYSKEPVLMEVFNTGGDPHQATADRINVERSFGKTINFATLYQSGPRTLADTIEKGGQKRPSLDVTKKWLNDFKNAYPTMSLWMDRVVQHASRLGYIRTIGGRRRRLPDINSPIDGLRARAERQAINSIIQGSASDVLKWVMLALEPLNKEYGAYVNAQVHDELLWETPIDHYEEFAWKAAGIMESATEHFNLSVKLEATPGVGRSWAIAKNETLEKKEA